MTEEEFQQMLAGAAGAVSQTAAPVPQVWLGGLTSRATPQVSATVPGALIPSKGNTGQQYAPVTVDEAALEFQSWDEAQLLAFQAQLKKAGIEANTVFDLQQMWSQVVGLASQSYSAYQAGIIDKPQSPDEVIKQLVSLGQQSGIGTSNEPTTVTQTETTNLSASDARAQAEASFQSELGRDPAGAQADGMATSSTSTRTVTTDADGNTTATTESGANLGQLAAEYARGQDDWAEYQASTTYMNAFLSSLAAVS